MVRKLVGIVVCKIFGFPIGEFEEWVEKEEEPRIVYVPYPGSSVEQKSSQPINVFPPASNIVRGDAK